MKTFLYSFILLFAFVSTSLFAETVGSEITDFKTFRNDLFLLKPDAKNCAKVKDFQLTRDVGTFNFKKGNFYFFKPLNKKVFFAIYKGTGDFLFTPPEKLEKIQLKKVYGSAEYKREFESAFFVFTDDTYEAIKKTSGIVALTVPKDLDEIRREAVKYIKKLEVGILPQIAHTKSSPSFFALLNIKDEDPVIWSVSTNSLKEVKFMRCFPARHVFEPICSFHKQADYALTETERNIPVPDPIRVTKYKTHVKIKDNLSMVNTYDVEYEADRNDYQWIPMFIHPKMSVDSVVASDGNKLNFFKDGEDGYMIYIRLKSATEIGEDDSFKMYAHGDVIRKVRDYLVMGSELPWYPAYDDAKKEFDMTFEYPSKYKFFASGSKEDEETNDGVTTCRYVTEDPVESVYFNFDLYEKYESENEDLKLNLYYTHSSNIDIIEEYVTTSAQYFKELYGPIDFKKLNVYESADYQNHNFKDALHVHFQIFEKFEKDSELYLASNISKKWWGGAIEAYSGKDAWLEHAFVRYSVKMYYQSVLQESKKFFDNLEKNRTKLFKEVAGKDGVLLGNGILTLGSKNALSDFKGQYQATMFAKAPYILHMIRNLTLNLNTMDDSKFKNIIKDFFQTYKGKEYTTTDFKKIVEKHVKGNMDWFFNQWVYGSGIPTYKYSYKTEEMSDGKFQMTMIVEQTGVPASFMMFVPIKLDFGDDQYSYSRKLVRGAKSKIIFKNLPMKPKSVEFNVFGSVLCDTEEVEFGK